jgi:hypothetical protein
MKPETVLRAYRKSWLPVRNGWQGPIRARRARQRKRFIDWLYQWAYKGQPKEVTNWDDEPS